MEDKLILLVEDNPHIMAINDAAFAARIAEDFLKLYYMKRNGE